MMSNLHAINAELFGIGLQVSMVTLFLGVLFGYGVCLPIQYRLEGVLSDGSKHERASEVIPVLVLAVLVWLSRMVIDAIVHL